MNASMTLECFEYPPLAPALLELEIDMDFTVDKYYPATWYYPAEGGGVEHMDFTITRAIVVSEDGEGRTATEQELRELAAYIETNEAIQEDMLAACMKSFGKRPTRAEYYENDKE